MSQFKNALGNMMEKGLDLAESPLLPVQEASSGSSAGRADVVIHVDKGMARVTRKPRGVDVAILDYDVQDYGEEEELRKAKETAKEIGRAHV